MFNFSLWRDCKLCLSNRHDLRSLTHRTDELLWRLQILLIFSWPQCLKIEVVADHRWQACVWYHHFVCIPTQDHHWLCSRWSWQGCIPQLCSLFCTQFHREQANPRVWQHFFRFRTQPSRYSQKFEVPLLLNVGHLDGFVHMGWFL